MKRPTLLIALFIGTLLGCSDNSSKTNVAKTAKSEKPAIAEPMDFDVFFKKFKSDSVFQITHVKLPLKLSLEEGSTTKIIKKENWRYLQFPNTKEAIYKKHQINKDQVIIQYMVEDTGISVNHYFVYSKGQWQLTFIKDESD